MRAFPLLQSRLDSVRPAARVGMMLGSLAIVAAVCVATPAHAQQATDPDASPGGVLPVPYIVPRTSTVDQVSLADKKRLKRSYVRQKAAERDTLMVLANAIPVTPSTPTTLTAAAAFSQRPVVYAAPAATRSAAPVRAATPAPAASATRGNTPPTPTEPAYTDPAYTEPQQTDGNRAVVSPPSQVAADAADATNAATNRDAPADRAVAVEDQLPDTTATVADSTGEYFIIRPVLQGTHLRRITVNRVVGLAAEYARRNLVVTYIIAVEAAPNDDDATDELLTEADALRQRLIAAGAGEQRVVVRDATPTGPKSSLRILLRGPRIPSAQPASTNARRMGTGRPTTSL